MVLDMLTETELDQLHGKLTAGTVALANQFIAGCQADMTKVGGWFAGSPEAAVLKAAMDEQAELAREVGATLRDRREWPGNLYEQACDRFNRASNNYPKAKAEAARILRAAEDEYEAAERNLRQYESRPGIPKPEYR